MAPVGPMRVPFEFDPVQPSGKILAKSMQGLPSAFACEGFLKHARRGGTKHCARDVPGSPKHCGKAADGCILTRRSEPGEQQWANVEGLVEVRGVGGEECADEN